MSILVASQITCEKQDRILFQDIDLTMDGGDLVMLKGENGAGKTSLLRILVGLSAPVSGSVLINQYDVQSEINFASSRLVYAGHKLSVSLLQSPLENLQFYCELIGIKSVNTLMIMQLLSQLSLDGLEDLPVKFLSAGQQRRVNLAKLWLHTNANLWVLDEPFTALDVATVQLLEQHVEQFLKAGGAVIMTSHQANSIAHASREFVLEYQW